ncbi:MAG TPA: transcriptional regulator [Noviherbaspirillum sp.]|jgi:transcriptional regulator with XRE-family HTH domain|uniref:transcriptional regulator n=1 Tax=Noviherbaspirillum sp. TaxID=1926288 RepID=UPI002DDCF54D|nr:transcriptional regulator [Noviherbaspirillum sp.]HEV2611063.1 transcriptional regulator [Noviherbaspirillum sp.]
MPTNEEKAAFSKRLELALRRSPEPVRGATELALRFNLKYQGNAISAQTAHKWLTGRAIPTTDKLATLAAWLNVSEHWLHYGPPPNPPQVAEQRGRYGVTLQGKAASDAKHAAKPAPETLELALKIQMLPPESRYLVEELVKQLQPKI